VENGGRSYKADASLVPYIDMMKMSDEEIVLLTGENTPEEDAKKVLAEGEFLLLSLHWETKAHTLQEKMADSM
jgi:sugar/nucleoside kinase (ribokinase family)